MIVVFGSTGTVGRTVVRHLSEHGVPLRAVSRNPEVAASVLPEGTQIVRADLADSASVKAAVRGAEAVLVLSPHSSSQHDLQSRLIDACAAAGTTRVVKLSALDAAVRADSPSRVGRLHWATESHLRSSTAGWTVVRPTPFMQNVSDWLSTAVRLGRLMLPMGHAPVAMVDASDVGAVLAAALVEDGHHGRTYVVTGPQALSLDDVAQIIGRVRLQRLRYTPVPARVVAMAQRRQGVDPWLVAHASAMAGLLSSGEASTVTMTVAELTGRPPRSFVDFAAEHFEVGVRHSGGPVGVDATAQLSFDR